MEFPILPYELPNVDVEFNQWALQLVCSRFRIPKRLVGDAKYVFIDSYDGSMDSYGGHCNGLVRLYACTLCGMDGTFIRYVLYHELAHRILKHEPHNTLEEYVTTERQADYLALECAPAKEKAKFRKYMDRDLKTEYETLVKRRFNVTIKTAEAKCQP